jgi:tRNA (mo5U34)-methyltransferase
VSKARDSAAASEARQQIAGLEALGWYHSIQLPGGKVIPGLQSLAQLRKRIAQFPIPRDLTGKRVLDIGAWDGWFSFEMERRGAQVVAVDRTAQTRFLEAKRLLGSQVEYHIADVLSLTPAAIGTFDIVLFLGVLYHVKHPLLALERVCALTRGMACIESFISEALSEIPLMEFYETTELCGQFDNWVGPNRACLLAMCRAAGFARVNWESAIEDRAHLTCFRAWPELAESSGEAPVIVAVQNSETRTRSFSVRRDDYLSIWFRSGAPALTIDDVFPMVGPFGVRPVQIYSTGQNGWHIGCKLPLGLSPGMHAVKVRVRESAWSNLAPIPVDVPGSAPRPFAAGSQFSIAGATDGRTWEPGRVNTGAGSCVSVWIEGLAAAIPKQGVSLRLGAAEIPAVFVGEPDAGGYIQVNALLPADLEPGRYPLTVTIFGAESEPFPVELKPQDG